MLLDIPIMEWILYNWFTWFIWSFVIVWMTKTVLFAVFSRLFARRTALIASYVIFLPLFILGLLLVPPMYGFDNTNLKHQVGYFTFYLSPLGIPIILGLPIVGVFDLIRRQWKQKTP